MASERGLVSDIEIVRAGHVEILVTDLDRARRFYVDTLGFITTESDETHCYLRGLEDRMHHCLTLTKADAPGVGHLAFRVAKGSLEKLQKLVAGKGWYTRWVEAEEERGQGRALMLQDQFGFPVEFYAEMERNDWMLQNFDSYKGAKVLRLDHFNIMLPDVSSAYDWYVDSLGFKVSELTETEDKVPAMWSAWLRRKETSHDLALTTGKGPRVHHAGFTVPDRGAIMDCADILASSGYLGSIERGPGRHGVTNAFFLYLRDPDGNRIELYTGDYLTADPDLAPIKWKLNDPQRQTFWGSPTPESWFNEAMRVLSPETREFVNVTAPKIVDRPDYLRSTR